ncbi:MAG: cytochrome c oxidase subunit 3 [Akkermansiaceae bacterium]
MEIPFVVNTRKDTGLNNSKVGIWLFLASEVTLFGGLFSGYLFLRLYADYPWPERTLPILPGLLNTFILIGSSVTVVFAWAALKMRQWGKFQLYMGITLICALLFMVLKAFEYNAKFNHQAVRILDDGPVNDFAILEGHAHYAKLEGGKIVPANSGDEGYFKHNVVAMNTNSVTFTLTRPVHDQYVADLIKQAGGEDQFTLAEDYQIKNPKTGEMVTVLAAGTALSSDALDLAEEHFIDGKTSDAEVRTAFLKSDWSKVRDLESVTRADNGDILNPSTEQGWKIILTKEWAEIQAASAKDMEGHLVKAGGTVTFNLASPTLFYFDPDAVVNTGSDQLRLRDDTVINGSLDAEASSLPMAVDGIDFRFTAQRAIEEGIDPDAAIAGSWILENPEIKQMWDSHQEWLRGHKENLKDKDEDYVPTDSELYRVNWDQMVAYHEANHEGIYEKAKAGELHMSEFRKWVDGFTGPSHAEGSASKASFPEIVIPRDKIGFESSFTPKWNTYYAIYFTITGLHGLHVIGGIIVLGYYLFFGRKMYESNPDWLANRVEVGGLFWHFVDLVWIFLFPILYLM